MFRTRIIGAAFVALLSVLLSAAAWAQSSGSGSIAGTVKDSSGGVVPGVTVEAASPALIEKVRSVVSDGAGEYKIVDLRPGTYTVTFTLPGFNTFRREGIELTTAFTATVNAEMRVGALEETVTVTGASPVVDTQNVRSQAILSRATIDTLPTGKTIQSYAALTPGIANSQSTMQDVGGNKGEQYGAVVSHGSRGQDSTLTLDGMRFSNSFNLGGGGQRFYNPNSAAVSEVAVETSGMSAEVNTGGVAMNSVPKDGGNIFSVYFNGGGTNEHMQARNLTEPLAARGLKVVGHSKTIWDFGGGVGGPIKRDRLWFFGAARNWGSSEYASDVFWNKTQGDFLGAPGSGVSLYSPDPDRQGNNYYPFRDYSLRLTYQATSKHKFTVSDSNQRACMCRYRLETGVNAPEGITDWWFSPNFLTMGTWTYTATNRLLFQAGAAKMTARLNGRNPEGVTNDAISILDLGRNFRYNAPAGVMLSYGLVNDKGSDVGQHNERASMSYVTGSHSFKAGFFSQFGVESIENMRGVNKGLHYQFLNGAPARIVQWATPVTSKSQFNELAFFAQDQWTIRNMTLNLGLRFDKGWGFVPEQVRPAGLFVPELKVSRIDNVPNFTDLSPRFGVAYDLFGNGRTAIKGSIGRYVGQYGSVLTAQSNPANNLVNSATRTWSDTNKNYIPDCDLRNPAANNGGDACGALDNTKFGTVQSNLRYLPDAISGFGNREYNWQTSVAVQHELRPGMGLTVGYFRTWFGNFQVLDNILTGPADYQSFCITAPVDTRLPGGGGYQICDLSDVVPSKFGQNQYVVDNIRNYPNKPRSEVFNGVDTNLNVRFGQGGLLQGGVSWGRTAVQCAGLSSIFLRGLYPSVDVDSPVQFCKNVPPYLPEFKFSGIYPLPFWGLQVSATLQQLPGPGFGQTSSGEGESNALYVLTNPGLAAAKSTLGRPLNGGFALVSIVEPNQNFEDRITQVDLRLTKILQLGKARIRGNIDLYNLFNEDAVLAQNVRYGPTFRKPTAILGARLLKLGAQFEF